MKNGEFESSCVVCKAEHVRQLDDSFKNIFLLVEDKVYPEVEQISQGEVDDDVNNGFPESPVSAHPKITCIHKDDVEYVDKCNYYLEIDNIDCLSCELGYSLVENECKEIEQCVNKKYQGLNPSLIPLVSCYECN